MSVPPSVPDGEFLVTAERLVVAPAAGRFSPVTEPLAEVAVGSEVGSVVTSAGRVPVISAFAGRWMGSFTDAGERVRDGQAVGWLRLADR